MSLNLHGRRFLSLLDPASDEIRFPFRFSAGLKAAKHGGCEQGAWIAITKSTEEAVDGTDFVYTDVCVSMDEPDVVWKERIEQLSLYGVITELMWRNSNLCTKLMHCLRAFHINEAEIVAETHEKQGIDCMEMTEEGSSSRRRSL